MTLYERKGEIAHGAKPELKKVKEEQIRVNYPLLNELNKMTFSLIDKNTEESFGQITVDLNEPKKQYDLGNGHKVEIRVTRI